MRFRKKVLVLCLIMVLSVAAGCGKQDTDNTVDAAEKIEGDAQEQQEESEAEKDAEEMKRSLSSMIRYVKKSRKSFR